jgi:hypothetical protein
VRSWRVTAKVRAARVSRPHPDRVIPADLSTVRLHLLLVGGDGVVDAREDPHAEAAGVGLQVRAAEQLGGAAEHLQRPLGRRGHPQPHPLPVEVFRQLRQPVERGDLEVVDSAQVQEHHPRRGLLAGGDGGDVVDHAAGVGEEQPSLRPDGQQGIMAMIGRKAAVAEIGEHRHEMHGRFAFAAWLGVHAQLLANAGAELNAFLSWADEFYLRPHHRSAALLDPSTIDTPRIHWRRGG